MIENLLVGTCPADEFRHLHLHRFCATDKKLAKFVSLPQVVEGREDILEVRANTIPPYQQFTISPFSPFSILLGYRV